ncbi:hypothetical protein [Rhizobium leguminosarum]|uniref:hypothetical protein n=1 Tax=Rhizobium leguminosarum TaxID=384 RepID=UPI001441774F|nr:hypothetical protein [Rhizobium leguminosarum]NKL98676.1 hypothetical protein [Rhizobium leguminosarum bv. viciae]
MAFDQTAEAEAREKAALDLKVDAFRAEVQAIQSREKLRIEIEALKAAASNKAAATLAGDYLASGKILVLQDRLIGLEGKESRMAISGWWITLVGTISGLAGLAIGFILGSSG